MPQYTASHTTPSGVLFVTVIDTTKNIVTDTATAPNGVTATVTRPLGTSTTDITTDIYQQLANNGYTKDSYPQDLNAVNAIQRNVDTQAKTAEAVSLATGNPPPEEKQALTAAAQHISQLAGRIQGSGKVSGNERIAVMAAIQVAIELLSVKAPDGPLGGLAVGDFKRRIDDMNAMLDAALPKPSSKAR